MNTDLKPIGGAPDFQIRREWRVEPLRRVGMVRSEKGRPDLPLLSVFLGRGVIQYGEGGGQVHKPGKDLAAYQVVHNGDFVLNNQQAWRGSVGVSKYLGIISPAYVVLSLNESLNPRFADYLFQSRPMVAQNVTASKGVGDIQRDVHLPWLKNIKVPVPPIDEQDAIVQFLNHANAKIERAIQAKKELIVLLSEKKHAIIHRAVTRGTDPDINLKPSGIPWLGEIPDSWHVTRIKNLLREVDCRSVTGSEPLLSMRMHHGLVRFHEHYSRPPQAATLIGFKVVRPGQFVVNRMQAGNGLIFASKLFGLVSPDYAVFDPVGDANVEYLGELFRSRKMRAKFRSESKGLGTGTSGFLRLYNDRMGAIHVALPPSGQQQIILSALAEWLEESYILIKCAEEQIQLLREYRTRLLADLVTGNLDVREKARNLPDEVKAIPVVDDEELEPEIEEAEEEAG